jgi:hypothetical protein
MSNVKFTWGWPRIRKLAQKFDWKLLFIEALSCSKCCANPVNFTLQVLGGPGVPRESVELAPDPGTGSY